MVRHATEAIDRLSIHTFNYRKVHMLKEVSDATIMHFMEKPVIVELQVIQRVTQFDELTHRSSFSASVDPQSSFARQMESEVVEIKDFQDISPPAKSSIISTSESGSIIRAPASTNTSPSKKIATGVIY
jgi:hypothetical protein